MKKRIVTNSTPTVRNWFYREKETTEPKPSDTQELTREAANQFKRKRIKENLIPALEDLLSIFPDEIDASETVLENSPDLLVSVGFGQGTPIVRIERMIDGMKVGVANVSISNLIALARRSVI